MSLKCRAYFYYTFRDAEVLKNQYVIELISPLTPTRFLIIFTTDICNDGVSVRSSRAVAEPEQSTIRSFSLLF